MIPLTRSRLASFSAVILAILALSGHLHAADVVKANNNDALNLTTSWFSGTLPTSADVALYNSTITGNRTNALGADLSWAGIRLAGTGAAATMAISGALNTLTLGASGIDMTAATANLSISTNLSLGANQTWNVASGRSLSASGTISGSGGLNLQGSGTFVISGNTNSYSGGTTLNTGVKVALNSSGTAGTPFGSGTLTVNGDAQLFGSSAGNRYVNNALVLNADLTVGSSTVANSNFILGGGIDVGSGTRTISIINAAAPTTSLPGLAINPTGAMTGTGTLVLENGNLADTPEVWVRYGQSGANALQANLTIGTGVQVFFFGSNMLSSSSALTVNSGGLLDLSNKGGSAYVQTVESLAGSGAVTTFKSSAGNSTLNIDGGASTGTTAFTGNITSGTAAGASIAITKTGSTTQIFSGSNTYIGQTQVNVGSLLVNGTHVDSEATSGNGYGSAINGHYLVASGATLGGSGRIAGNTAANNSNMILVQSGGFLAPGASIGTLKLDGATIGGTNSRVLNMASGADFVFELAGDGTSSDQIEMWNYSSGDLLLNTNDINLSISGPVVAGTYTVTIFEFYSNSGTTLTTSGISSGLAIGTLDSSISGATLLYDSAGGTISLQYSVVPEPSAVLLAGIGLAFVLWRSRRPGMAA
ncbi:MAG: beta strand repeat-containing protein [Terrimicrobiaceae bacterium]